MWNDTILEIAENSVAEATWHPNFVQPCLNCYLLFPHYNCDCIP